MANLAARIRASQWWVIALVVLGAIIGWEIDWGNALHKPSPPADPIVPKPVSVGLLPEYSIAGGLEGHAETVNRTLFNPTRRPAPAAIAAAEKTQMTKGQFVLTGTTIAGDRSLAFLKETKKDGKARTVREGEKIEGVLVAEVKPDRVRLTMGDDSEELVLKVLTNPKTTPQPAEKPAQGTAANAPRPVPGAAQPNPAQTLAERRRAARAAAAAAAAAGGAPAPAAGGAPAPAQAAPPQPGAATQNPEQSGWARVYERLRNRRAQ
jgi:hypothetical protein